MENKFACSKQNIRATRINAVLSIRAQVEIRCADWVIECAPVCKVTAAAKFTAETIVALKCQAKLYQLSLAHAVEIWNGS